MTMIFNYLYLLFINAITKLKDTISTISSQMSSNSLSNLSKTEFMLIGLLQQPSNSLTPPNITHSSYSPPVRPKLQLPLPRILASSLIIIYVFFYTTLLYSILATITSATSVDGIRHTLDRLHYRFICWTVSKRPIREHIAIILKSLHWIKIAQRIQYKIISLSYNFLQNQNPSYLWHLQPAV